MTPEVPVPTRVLVVDDSEPIHKLIEARLRPEGLEVTRELGGARGVERAIADRPDLILLDIDLPDLDGFEVCRRVRTGHDIPILMLTARGDETDRIVGLELGADDYLPKPFNPRELLARLRAILRRRSGIGDKRSETLRFGRLEIDRAARVVRLAGDERAVTSYQFDLLWALATHAGRVMSREALMDLVKNEPLEAYDRSIDVHIARIRQAIEDDPKKPSRILTVRGAGYVFAKAQR